MILLVLGIVQVLGVPSAFAQFRGGRYYTRNVPYAPPAPQPPRYNYNNNQGKATTPAPGTTNAPAMVMAAPPGPAVDPEKERSEKEATVKRTVDFQKMRAEHGSPSAQYDLGVRYMTGDGVDKDLPEARKWLEAAAKNGHTWAPKKLEELTQLEKDAGIEAPVKPKSPAKGAVIEADKSDPAPKPTATPKAEQLSSAKPEQ